MMKASGRPPRNDLPRFVQVRQTADGTAYYWCVPARCRKLLGCPRSSPLGNSLASAKWQAAALNEQFNVWQLQRVKYQLGIQQAGGFSGHHPMKTEPAQNFQMAGGINFQMRLKILGENKAVSVMS
jgi:hypothetical protein